MEATADCDMSLRRWKRKQAFPLYDCAHLEAQSCSELEDFNASEVFIHSNFIRDTPLERLGRVRKGVGWPGRWLKGPGFSLKSGVRWASRETYAFLGLISNSQLPPSSAPHPSTRRRTFGRAGEFWLCGFDWSKTITSENKELRSNFLLSRIPLVSLSK